MNLIKNAMKQTERWRVFKNAGMSEEEIEKTFHVPYKMDVFAYVKENGKHVPGSKTVTMTPYDSLLYMKSILRTGMMSMDPHNGYVKAYVGGPDFTYFQYDMVSRGRRQIGSTAKPSSTLLPWSKTSHLVHNSLTLNPPSATGRLEIREVRGLATW